MTDEEFLQKLREAFAIEAEEHLQTMTSSLLELEKAPGAARQKEIVEVIFREAHSLKGAARAVSRTDIEAVCQALESVFAVWKSKGATISEETFDTLNAALDFVTMLHGRPDVAKSGTERNALQDMVRQISRFAGPPPARSRPATSPERPVPVATPANPLTPVLVATTPAVTEVPSVPPPVAGDPSLSTPVPPPAATTPAPAATPLAPLPAAGDASASPPEPEHLTITPDPAAHEPERHSAAETVRVPLAKMDALLLQAEEMVAVKLYAGQHVAALRELAATLELWRKEWMKVRAATGPAATTGNGAPGAKLREFLDWNESQMEALGKSLGSLTKIAERDERIVGTLIDDLLDDAKQLVMLPFARLLDLFPKQVRDLSREQGKQIELILHGREVEIDKRILEEMKAPLLHLVRNAIDHGLEKPDARTLHGKPARGTLTITVSQRDGNKVEIVVSDDGKGIDLTKVKAAAAKSGSVTESDAGQMSDAAALALIFQSGVSTSPILTEISGRGLGMAIVREKVEKLGGQIAIETKPHLGTSFQMLLPVTLATFKGILVGASGQTFVIPTSSIEGITRVKRDEIKTVENRETMDYNGRVLSLAWLAEVLELPPLEAQNPRAFVEVLILGAGEQRIAFVVEAVFSEQEVLVKKLGKPLMRVRNIAGATVLGSGTPVLILNVADLLQSAVLLATGGGGRMAQGAAAQGEARPRHVLVADDSVTSRMLIKNILESAGYLVTTAIDGLEAFTTLRGGEFDAVVSDVEMPRMNGFEFTAKIRAEQKYTDLPVVLVTALNSREDQERGIDVGANAYIVKGSFDQSNLLEVIGRLV